MPEIHVRVSSRAAKRDNKVVYVCGNTDYIVKFFFDEEWDEYPVKTARFVSEGQSVDVVFTGDECPMPAFTDTYTIYVGVFAGDLRTTTPALIIATKSILCGSEMPAEPTPDVYAQIMEIVNDVYENTHESELAAKESEKNAAASEQAAAEMNESTLQAMNAAAVSAEGAEESAESARESAESAAQCAAYAEQTAATSGYMSFVIDDNGHLQYLRTENVEVTFAMEDGRLIVNE